MSFPFTLPDTYQSLETENWECGTGVYFRCNNGKYALAIRNNFDDTKYAYSFSDYEGYNLS